MNVDDRKVRSTVDVCIPQILNSGSSWSCSESNLIKRDIGELILVHSSMYKNKLFSHQFVFVFCCFLLYTMRDFIAQGEENSSFLLVHIITNVYRCQNKWIIIRKKIIIMIIEKNTVVGERENQLNSEKLNVHGLFLPTHDVRRFSFWRLKRCRGETGEHRPILLLHYHSFNTRI